MPKKVSALAQFLVDWRTKNGLSQMDFVKKSGASRSSVERAERGQRCDAETLLTFANAMAVSVDVLHALQAPRMPRIAGADFLSIYFGGYLSNGVFEYDEPTTDAENELLAAAQQHFYSCMDLWRDSPPAVRQEATRLWAEYLQRLADAGWELRGERQVVSHGEVVVAVLRVHAERGRATAKAASTLKRVAALTSSGRLH